MTTVLCIEDEAPLRRIITAELRDAGYATLEAHDGREGLAVIAAHRPDLVLCDVNMPVMGGYETLSMLREQKDDLSDIPFVFLSALSDRKDVIAGRKLGADDFISKPVDFELLLATVAVHLDRVRRRHLRYDAERQRIDEERQVALDTLQRLATHDELTGLANRAHLVTLLDDAVATAGPRRGPVLMLFDVDRVKTVAATLGRPYADDMLRLAARRLQSEVGKDAVAARVGDERFACLYPKGAALGKLGRLAESVRHFMTAPYSIGGRVISSTVTLGVASYPEHGATGIELMTKAEAALHDASRQGGNIWRIYDPLAAKRQLERLTIEDALRTALAGDEFQVCFQPKVAIHGLRAVGMEALLRWNSASMGWVSPAAFIPVAEETGLILAIGEHVLRESCRRMKGWLDAGFPEDMKVAVNVSVKQFQHPDLVDSVERTLDQTGLDSRSLVLEITESGLVEDSTDLVGTLGALRDLGVTLSIDDFGTGYSSLSYLGRLPAHELKIDQSFVRGLPDTVGSRTIVEAIIAIARSLNLKLVAEGVETEEQLAFLEERGCDVAQGYLFSRPLVPADFETFVRDRMRTSG